jgi:hypothetical protein
VEHQIKKLSIAFLVGAVVALVAAYYAGSFAQQALLNVFGTALSAAVGLFIVNVVLDKKSRRIAAGPLMQLIHEPITYYHNDLVIEAGRNKFGIPNYSKITDAYNANRGNPQVLSQSERIMFNELIEENITEINACIDDIDSRLSDMINVLGWSYDAKIISSALHCKRNILGFKSLANPANDAEKLRRIEYYIDIDTSSSAVIVTLANIYGKSIIADHQ